MVRAAEYVRMSTEHQKYSTENQADALRRYAERRGMEIVQTYADQGKSGLKLDGRDALKRLIDDVQNGRADFEAILVYDVSRWGRFQDADESAYYEYICKRAGITVQYCAEQFEKRRQPGLDDRQGRQARHGRRVQSRTIGHPRRATAGHVPPAVAMPATNDVDRRANRASTGRVRCVHLTGSLIHSCPFNGLNNLRLVLPTKATG